MNFEKRTFQILIQGSTGHVLVNEPHVVAFNAITNKGCQVSMMNSHQKFNLQQLKTASHFKKCN